MLDHGQLGPATPADSPITSRRSSNSSQAIPIPRRPSGEFAPRRPSRLSFSSKFGESLSMSSIEPTNVSTVHPLHTLRSMSSSMDSTSALDIEDESETELNTLPSSKVTKEDISSDAAHFSGLQLSDAVVSTVTNGEARLEVQSKGGDVAEGASLPVELPTTHFISPSDLSSQLFANPTLAALRSANSQVSPSSVNSPPILMNTKCSGYFVEPVRF